MTSTAVATRDDNIKQLVAAVSSDDFQQQVARALPGNVTPQRFGRVAITALQTNPALGEDVDHNSIFRSLLRCAGDGLLPDGREAALVIFNSKEKINGADVWVKKAQYMPMIGGFRKIAAEHGWTLTTRVVYANDVFEHQLGVDENIVHLPVRPGAERGDLVAAYAIASHGNRRELEVMYRDDIERAKKVSRSSERGPWQDWPDRMWEKTVGRRLFAKLPLGDRELAQRVVEAAALADGEAADELYGPTTARELPPGESTIQQADVAARGNDTRSEAAPSVPGPEFDDEPPMDDEPVATDDAAVDAELATAADQAAMVTFPNGRNVGKSIGEVYNVGETGRKYLTWALAKFDDKPELSSALFAFCRVYMPDEYQAELTKREAQVAR